MFATRLKIFGFRGVSEADITLGRHTVLVGPNNSGKTTAIEAMALLFGRDRLVRRLTEHDFYGSAPDETSRIKIIATITGFPQNDPQHNTAWFGADRGVEGRDSKARPCAAHADGNIFEGRGGRRRRRELKA